MAEKLPGPEDVYVKELATVPFDEEDSICTKETKALKKKRKKVYGSGLDMASNLKDSPGIVYIARIRRSQKHPKRDDILNVNVTSSSGNKVGGVAVAKIFSPFYIGPVTDGDGLFFRTMEGYWQGNKIYKELGHLDKAGKTTDAWETFRREQARLEKGARHPRCLRTDEVKFVDERGHNQYKYLLPVCAKYDGKIMDYLDSRKKAYAPKYHDLVVKKKTFKVLKSQVENGQSVMILDFDGPQNDPEGRKVTIELLREKINDTSTPFGHGYVLAGALLGIEPHQYCT